MRYGVTAFLVISFPISLQGADCRLKPGLYHARTSVVERYAREVGNDYAGHKLLADTLQQQKRNIDQEYFHFMERVSQSVSLKKPGDTKSCCNQTAGDPIARQICALGLYLDGHRKDAASFLRNVPADKETADALWALDEIAYYKGDETNQAALPFGPNGPVDRYLGELFRTVASGDREGIRGFLGLYAFADGEYAETMEDQLEKLFLEHSRIVVSNWEIISGYKGPLSDVRERMSAEQRRKASALVQKECVPARTECKEVLAFLK